MAKREWKLSVGIDTVLEKDSLQKAEKQLEELEKPIQVKVSTKDAEKKIGRLNSQLEEFEKEERRLAKEFSKAMASGDEKSVKQTVTAQQKLEDQLKRVRKEREGINSELRTYQKELKAARGETRKLSEEEKKVNSLIEKSKTARPPRKPKAKSDSGDAAAAKEETKANEQLAAAVEKVGKAKRKAKSEKPQTTDADVAKEEAKANEQLADAIETVGKAKRKSRTSKPKVSDTEQVKEEAKANEQLADAIDAVTKAKGKSKSVKPKINEAEAAKQQAKANEELAKSYEKVGKARKTAQEAYLASKKVYQVVGGELPNEGRGSILYPNRELADRHASNVNKLGYNLGVIERTYGELGEEAREAFEKAFYSEPENKKVVGRNIPLSAQDIDTYLAMIEGRDDFKNQYKRLSGLREQGAGAANIKLSHTLRDQLEMILEEDTNASEVEVELIERILQRRRSNEDLLKKYISAPEIAQPSSTEKQVKENKELAASYEQIFDALKQIRDLENKLRDSDYSDDSAAKKMDTARDVRSAISNIEHKQFPYIAKAFRDEDFNPNDVTIDFTTTDTMLREMAESIAVYATKTKEELGELKLIKIDTSGTELLNLELKNITDNAGNAVDAYRGLANEAQSSGILTTGHHSGATWFSTQKDVANGYTRGSGNLYRANLQARRLFEIDANNSSWNSITFLGDGSDEASRIITELYNKKKELKEESHRLAEANQMESQSYKEVNAALRRLTADYEYYSKSLDNPYGTNDTNWYAKYAKENGYDAFRINNVYDTLQGGGLSDIIGVFSAEQIVNVVRMSDVIESQTEVLKENTQAAQENADAHKTREKVKKPELLENIEVLEDREPMQDAKTVAQKRKAAEDMLREQWRFYQDMKKEYDDPENATHIYGTDYEGLLQQGQRLEAYIALYEKYGGSVEKVGKKLKSFSDEQGFTGAYQYAVDEYNEQLRVTERQEASNEELAESSKTVTQTSETAADAMREEAKAAGDAADETERLAKARKNAADSNIVKLTDNYGRALDDANNKLMQGTQLLNEQSQIIRLFHNSDNIFDQFDPSHISDSNLLGKGHYLSLDQMAYMSYGKYQTQWYANVQKMFDATDKNSMSTEDATKIIEKYCTDAVAEFTQRAFHELTNGNAFSAVNTIAEAYNLDISDILKTAGYDAIRANNEINVFDPSKIYRANPNVLQADSEDLIATSKLSEEILLTIMRISDFEGKAFKSFDQDRKNLEEQIALEKERLSLLQNRYDIYKRISDAEVARSLGIDFDEAAYRQALEERSRIASQIAQEEEEQKRKTADRALQTQDFIRRSQEFVPEGGFADGSEEMKLYSSLLDQLTKGLLVADDAMELFRSKLVHTDVGETSIGQSILELEKITGKSLIGVLNDYDSLDDGIKEKVNSILKSMGLMNDQLEFTFKRSQGGNAKAVLGQDFVVLQKALEADEGYAANLINKLKEAQELGLNVTPILERVFSESSAGSGGFRPGYEIQQRAAGSNVHETQKSLININSALQENQTLLGASENQLQKFIADYIKLDEIGVQVDPSKASNFLYDAEKGFSFIDLGLKNANDKAKDLKQIFKEITVVLANTSTFNALGQDESLGFSSGKIVAKVADSFEAIGIASREEIDSWAKEFYDGFGNIFDGYTGKTSGATQWIDELRAKADTLDEEFKNSQQYKDFFAAIESGSITAADGVRKLEESFNEFSAASVGSMAESPVAEIPNLLSAEQLTKAFDAVDLGVYFKSLNIKDEGVIQTLKDLYTQFLQLSKAELDGVDVGNKLSDTWDEIISTFMKFGTVAVDARDTYEDFFNYVNGSTFSYNKSEREELKYFFGDWSSVRSRFGKMLAPLSSGRGFGADQKWDELSKFSLFKPDDVNSPLVAILREFEKARAAKNNGWKVNKSLVDSSGIEHDFANQSNKMLAAALSTAESVEKEEAALEELEVQAEKTANAKKKVTKANKELGAESVSSKDKIGAESDAMEDLEEKANNVWSTPREGGSLEGLNLPTEFVGEDGQSVVQMFAKIKSEIEELTGSPVKIDFVSKPNADGELEAVGATLEYVNKESGVTIKQFYDIARGEDDVITATQTAEKATLSATKAQKQFNAELKKQLALQQIETLKKQMGEFPVDLTAVYKAANSIFDKASFDEFNIQLKIARESLAGMKAEMKGQNTLDPIVAAEKRLKSLDSELDSLKNKFVDKAGAGVGTKWIDDKIASIRRLYENFNKETDPNKKTGYYKQIIAELDQVDNSMTNLNELIRIQNKLFKDRKALSKMDKDTQSYKMAEESVRKQGEALSNLIRDSEHRETIMKRAIQFENELAAAIEDRQNKQNEKFDAKYAGSTILASGSWDKDTYADSREAMKAFAESALDGELAIKGFNKAGTEMYITLRDGEDAIHDVTVALDKNGDQIKAFETGTNGIADAFKSLGKSGASAVAKLAGTYLSLQDFIRYFRQGIQHVRDIDAAMTELRKVTDETEATYARFLETASKSAGQIGSTVKDFTTVTSDFARLGYTIEEASELAKTALIYENVGDGFSSVEEASESIISTMKAFGIEAENTMGIVDRFNEVGNNFAIDSKGIGDALQRSASALVEGGNSIDEAIALVTAANSVIQNPEQVGTALKTLSLRLRSTKIELEDMGEDAEGAATSTAKLREQLLGLTGGKVDIMLNETTFKNTTQILREMAAVWQEMDDISKAGALELMGGKRQANILSSLITNFETVEQVIETSANSAGSALAENQKYIESIQGHIDVFNNSLQTFWNNFINSEVIKGVVDLGTLILNFLNEIGSVLTSIVGIIGGASITTLAKGFNEWFKDTTGSVKLVDSLTKSFGNLKGGIVGVGKALGGLITSHPILLAIAAALAAITAVTIGVKKAEKEAALAAKEHATEVKKENAEIEDYKKQATDLRKELDSGNLSEQEAYDVRKQLLGIQDELISRYGDEAKGINLVTGAIEKQIAALDELAIKNAQNWLNENSKKQGWFADSAIDQAIEAMETKYETYDVYGTKVWNDVFKAGHDDDWQQYSEDAAQEYKDFIESLGGKLNLESNAIHFENVTREQIDDYYTQIQNWLRTYGKDNGLDFNNLIGKIETDKQERLGKDYQTHKANYDAYLENTAIASYTEAYGKILDAEDEFLNASTDEDKLAKIGEYKQNVADAMAEAEASGNVSMKNYFAEMQDKFAQEEFELKIKLNTDNVKTDLQKIINEGGDKGLSALDDLAIQDMINRGLNVEGATDASGAYTSEQIAGLIKLQEEADAAGISIQSLIDMLVSLGLIEGRPVEEASESVKAMGQAYSILSESAEKYASVNQVLNDITYDNIEISEEQYELLKELAGSEEEFAECIDTTNGFVVKNSKALKDLIKQKQKEQAIDVKRSRAQARLRYYDLYKQMHAATNGQKKLTGAALEEVKALYEQMNAIEKTIEKYNLLEQQLLGATDAFIAFEDAQNADSETDYISSAEDMVLALGQAFNTAELGSETAQAAITGLVPESVYEDLDTVDEKMAAIYEYFKKGKLSQYFDITFDEDGAIESAEMKLGNLRKFIEDGLLDSGANVFDGTDWQHFEFSDEFLSEIDKLPDGADKLQYFADKMNVTKEVAFAFIKSVKDHDIEWLKGDYSSLFDSLLPDSLSRNINDNITKLADFEYKLATGELSVEDYNKAMYGLDGQLKAGIITQEEYNDCIDILKQRLEDNEITTEKYNKLISGVSGYQSKLSEQAREEAAAWYTKTDQLEEYKKKLDDYYQQLESGVDSEGNAIDVEQIQKDIDETSGHINRLVKELAELEEPDEIVLQVAMDEVDKDLEAITKRIGEVVEGTHYKFNVEAGEYQVILDKTDPNYQEVMNYVTLLNERYSLELQMGEETPTVTDQLGKIAGILEKITNILAKTYGIDIETGDALEETNTFKELWDSIKDKSVTIWTTIKETVSDWFDDDDNDKSNGSTKPTRVNGSAHLTGNWGLSKAEHNSLVGELGQELVVDPHSGKYYTVGDKGAEFVDLPKDAIIFNHKQTESLLSNGYVVGRGKAYAEGNAHVTIFDDGSSKDQWRGTGYSSGDDPTWDAAEALSDSADDLSDASKEIIDFIEIKLDEIEVRISKASAKLETYTDNASTSSFENKNRLYDELVKAEEDKASTYYQAAKVYNKEASALLKTIPKEYRDMAKDGAIAIANFVGENETEVAERIQEYRDWATKADEAEVGYYEAIAQQAAYRVEQLEDIASDYENLVNFVGSESELIEAEMSLMEEFGAIQSPSDYQDLIDNSLEQIGYLQKEKRTLENELAEAVKNGDIIVGSDEWYEAKSIIADVDQAIVQCREDVVSWSNEMENLRWDALDRLMTRLEAIDSQLAHLFDRFTDGDVVDEAGNWTSKGIAALGVSFQKMESAQAQAKKYGEEIAQLDADFAAGLYEGREEVYYERREELTEKQWEAIEAYEAEKDAIIDLNKERIEAIKKGIDEEIDAYKELIEVKKEALDADKDSRDFERSVQDKQKEIDKIDRKLAALQGDNSASAAAQRKQLEEERAELTADLEDIYYDRSIENQKDALDKSGDEFEKSKEAEKESLDDYLDNEEQVISDSLNVVKSNTGIVLSEINGIAAQYGVSISTEITKPWKDGENAISSFSTSFTTFADNFDVSTFTEELQKIVKKYEDIEEAAKKAAAAAFELIGEDPSDIGNTDENPPKNDPPKTNNPSKSDPPKTQEPAKEPKYDTYTIKKGDNLWNLADKYLGSGAKYKDIYNVNKDVIKDPNKIYIGQTIKIPKYAKGTTGVKDDQFAWIDEIGEELVLHADGSGKLAYLTKGSSVIPSDLTNKLLDLVVDPTQTLENSRPIISAPQITNNEININMEFGEVVHIDTVTNDTIPDLTKAIEKQMDKYMKGLNSQIRKYSR